MPRRGNQTKPKKLSAIEKGNLLLKIERHPMRQRQWHIHLRFGLRRQSPIFRRRSWRCSRGDAFRLPLTSARYVCLLTRALEKITFSHREPCWKRNFIGLVVDAYPEFQGVARDVDACASCEPGHMDSRFVAEKQKTP
jgi:hypothetical protein